MQLLKPLHWQEYELIDSGHFEKLEKFGEYITIRPEPQAAWDSSLSEAEWKKMAHATFKRDPNNPEKGVWDTTKAPKPNWPLKYSHNGLNIHFKLSFSSFKHVGIFPEQAANWDYIFEQVKARKATNPKVLNLFAYTGGASLAAKAAGADVTHLDSIKQVVTWSRENMELSKLDNIRWIVDDAMKFIKREVKRGNKYQGVMLDPPAYGRGPNGERWVLEEDINEMITLCSQILDEKDHFFIINTYSIGFSYMVLDNLINKAFPFKKNEQSGELYMEDRFQKKLPTGIFYRFDS